MPCGVKEAGGVYRPRRPQESPFYRLVARSYPEFEAVYEEGCQERYGFWRPIIATVVRKFLECGDLKQGFARVRCPKCREELFVPFSCRVRCFCPSCHQKRALEKAGWVAEHVCAEVPHRPFVFTIPKRLRIYFRFDRRLLGELCRAAARTVITVYRAASGRPDAVPGMVGAIQTFGQLIHAHPHIHALVGEGVFLPDGTFLPLPKLATEPFLKLWEQEVFALLLAEDKITEEVVANIRSWKHSGFSVDQSVRLEPGDQQGVQRLIEYFLRCPFSQARRIEVTDAGKVSYKTEHNAVGRFPEPGGGGLLAGPARNFQVFDSPSLRPVGRALGSCPALGDEFLHASLRDRDSRQQSEANPSRSRCSKAGSTRGSRCRRSGGRRLDQRRRSSAGDPTMRVPIAWELELGLRSHLLRLGTSRAPGNPRGLET